MDARIEFHKTIFVQRGNGLDIPMFSGTSTYQYTQGLSDVLSGIVRCIPSIAQLFKPVAINSF